MGGRFVRWVFSLSAAGISTTLIESWEFLPEGIAMFEEKFGDKAHGEIGERARQALDGTQKTLAAVKRIAESVDANGDVRA